MTGGYDERCAADIANVVDGRALSSDDAAWLTRAVTGAMRPNRDKPVWDLAHLMGALARAPGADRANLCDLLFDPRLARGDAISRRLAAYDFAAGAGCDERGIVLSGPERDWRATWSGIARSLALAEFVMTAGDLAHFAEIGGWLDELTAAKGAQPAIDLLVKRLAQLIGGYRQGHVPLAPVERRFRAILTYLATQSARKDLAGFDDDDIMSFWRQEIETGEGPQFRTVAEHFVTYETMKAALCSLASLQQATSLEAIEDWADRLDQSLNDAVGFDDNAPRLAAALAGLPDVPKIVTGAERDGLIDILWLEPFHRARPLTVLRAISFGRVQSGIANRLRRGSGGADIAERVDCGDAEPYESVLARAAELRAHLERMTLIAAALRIDDDRRGDPAVAAALAKADADLGRIRRVGFDQDRAVLQAAFAAIDEALVRIAGEIGSFLKASAALSAGPPRCFEDDRAIFAAGFHATYLGKTKAHDRADTIAG